MNPYFGPIENLTAENSDFRRVIWTGTHTQLVLMSLKPGEDIGREVHDQVDQFFRFESGTGRVIIGDKEFSVADGDAVIVPAGTEHNIINTSPDTDLKLYTLYSPPNHPDGTLHVTKHDANLAESDHH